MWRSVVDPVLIQFPLTIQVLRQETLSLQFLIKHFHGVNQESSLEIKSEWRPSHPYVFLFCFVLIQNLVWSRLVISLSLGRMNGEHLSILYVAMGIRVCSFIWRLQLSFSRSLLHRYLVCLRLSGAFLYAGIMNLCT